MSHWFCEIETVGGKEDRVECLILGNTHGQGVNKQRGFRLGIQKLAENQNNALEWKPSAESISKGEVVGGFNSYREVRENKDLEVIRPLMAVRNVVMDIELQNDGWVLGGFRPHVDSI